MKRAWAVLFVLAAIGGCAGPETNDQTLSHAPTRMRGELRPTADGYTFQLCGAATARAVTDGTGGDLPGLWRTLGVDSLQVLFVEALVDTTGDSAVVSGIRRAQAGEGRGCDEDWNYEIRAHGNEPFWSVTVTRAAIVFEQPDEPRRVEFPYVAPSATTGTRTYRTVAASDTLVLMLMERRCQDGMSGFIFPLTARARVRGRELTGCASEGAP